LMLIHAVGCGATCSASLEETCVDPEPASGEALLQSRTPVLATGKKPVVEEAATADSASLEEEQAQSAEVDGRPGDGVPPPAPPGSAGRGVLVPGRGDTPAPGGVLAPGRPPAPAGRGVLGRREGGRRTRPRWSGQQRGGRRNVLDRKMPRSFPSLEEEQAQTNTSSNVSAEVDGACDEKMRGNRNDGYRGCQTKTRSGKTCQAWAAQSPQQHSRTAANYPSKGLTQNYCRNPDGERSIWCYTTDSGTRWELCYPMSSPEKCEPTRRRRRNTDMGSRRRRSC